MISEYTRIYNIGIGTGGLRLWQKLFVAYVPWYPEAFRNPYVFIDETYISFFLGGGEVCLRVMVYFLGFKELTLRGFNTREVGCGFSLRVISCDESARRDPINLTNPIFSVSWRTRNM